MVAQHGHKILLNAVSGQIHRGYCAIMGPSGSGKVRPKRITLHVCLSCSCFGSKHC